MSRQVCRRAAVALAFVALLVIALASTAPHASRIGRAAPAEHQNPDDYHVALATSQAGGGATWTYTITKAASAAPDLGNFVVNFGNCGDESPTAANIVSATVNGVDWLSNIDTLEGKTGCRVDSANFVKFDDLPPAPVHVIEFMLDDVYPVVETTSWLKAGELCIRKAVTGPGCKGYLRTTAMDADPSLWARCTPRSTPT